MQKYLKVKIPITITSDDCDMCALDSHKNCADCKLGEYLIINPAWKPASQRVRELAEESLYSFSAQGLFYKLSAELEQEEKEAGG